MSKPFLSSDILYTQRFLAFCGYYTGKLDGIHGPKTEAAIKLFDDAYHNLRSSIGEFDPRSEINIYTLLPASQILARKFLMETELTRSFDGLTIRIISGARSYEEQNRLYRIGRWGDKRAQVTKAKGGQSNHNFGIAFDIGIFRQGMYSQSRSDYIDVGAKITTRIDNLEWGGNWSTFRDYPHYQLETSKSVHVIREMFEKGEKLAI